MYFILNFIVQNINNILCGLIISFMLTPKYPRIKALLIFGFLGFFIFLYKFVNFTDSTALMISSLVSQLVLYSFVLITFKESLFKKLLSCIIVLSILMLAEYIALGLHNIFFDIPEAPLPDTKEFFISSIFGLFVQIIMYSLLLFIWKIFSHKKNSINLLYFTLLPTIQFFLLITFFAPSLFGNTALNPILLSVCIFVSLISNIILLYYILRRYEKKNAQDAYEELEKLYALDLEYYKELESKHEELSKIRHDYQNQLATLYMLISSDKIDSAKEFADSLKLSLQESNDIS